MSRKYTGRVKAAKLYLGRKSVGIQIDPSQALDLSIHLLEATKEKVPIDITIFTEKKNSDGTYHTTVTFKRDE